MENSENKTIIGYKGFNEDWKCRDMQYEVGKEYEYAGDVELCKSGYHFCRNPHDVFNYYSAGNGNKFAIVEASDVSCDNDSDSKKVAKKLKIKAEISVFEICKIAVSAFFENFGFKKKIKFADTNNAGYCGAANAGDRGAAIVLNNGRVKGGYGCVLVARNIEWSPKNGRYEVTDWACGIVDNITIEAGVWYELKEGKLVECRNQ